MLSPLHTIVPCVPIVPKPLFAWIFSGTMAGTQDFIVPEHTNVRLCVVGAVIGGPPVAMLFMSTPQSRLTPRQLPVKGSLLVRFTSLHIKPALKGEVANVVSRRGYKAAYSSLFITTPFVTAYAATLSP